MVEYAKSRGIDTIVISRECKQSIDMCSKNNRNFVQIPFNTLISQVRYKAEENGINVFVINESHTSKCQDFESTEHHDIHMGKRITRGRSQKEKMINVDLNGTYNMIRKASLTSSEDGINGVWLHPRSLSIEWVMSRETITSKGEC
ncbi:MAG: IS200/IS605 family accessory protein TnpB-related protein [Conexivisphaerales archaeon]